MTYRTIGIVLRRRDVNERDRLYSIYTPQLGRVDALAKSARKIQSKLTGAMESFGVVDLLIARGRSIDRLAGAELTEWFPGIYLDAARLECAQGALSLTENLTRPGIRDERIFTLLASYFRGLNTTEPVPFREFALRLLTFLGFISMQDAAKGTTVLRETLVGRTAPALQAFVVGRL